MLAGSDPTTDPGLLLDWPRAVLPPLVVGGLSRRDAFCDPSERVVAKLSNGPLAFSDSRRPACSSDGRLVRGTNPPRTSRSGIETFVRRSARGLPSRLPSYGWAWSLTAVGEEWEDVGEFELDLELEVSRYSACCCS